MFKTFVSLLSGHASYYVYTFFFGTPCIYSVLMTFIRAVTTKNCSRLEYDAV
jgi:hypothetical protein